jgi:hypothetical protein
MVSFLYQFGHRLVHDDDTKLRPRFAEVLEFCIIVAALSGAHFHAPLRRMISLFYY